MKNKSHEFFEDMKQDICEEIRRTGTCPSGMYALVTRHEEDTVVVMSFPEDPMDDNYDPMDGYKAFHVELMRPEILEVKGIFSVSFVSQEDGDFMLTLTKKGIHAKGEKKRYKVEHGASFVNEDGQLVTGNVSLVEVDKYGF